MYLIIEIKMATGYSTQSKIDTIKFIRSALEWGLKECKDFYEELSHKTYNELLVTPDQYGRLIATKSFEDSGDIERIVPLKIIKNVNELYVDIRGRK